MRREDKKQRKISIIMIFTLIVVLVWVGFSLFRAFSRETLPEIYQQQLVPFDPTFDQQTFTNLKGRKTISQEELDKVPEITGFEGKEKPASGAAQIPTVSPSPTLRPQASLMPISSPPPGTYEE